MDRPPITSTIPPPGPRPAVPATREHENTQTWVPPPTNRPRNAVETFIVRENSRLENHSRNGR